MSQEERIEWLAKAMMLALQGGYDLDDKASPQVQAYYERYRTAARSVDAFMADREDWSRRGHHPFDAMRPQSQAITQN